MGGFVPIESTDRKAMLASVGITDLDSLFASIPAAFRLKKGSKAPYQAQPQSELETIRHLTRLSNQNASTETHSCFLGAGAYDHYIPTAIDALVSRQEFLTAYTPYQPEISQGTLQAIFEFQSLICRLTGLEISNSSMYDGASAAAEALLMTIRQTGRNKVLLAGAVNPQIQQVVRTYLTAQNFVVENWPPQPHPPSHQLADALPEEPPATLDLSGYAGILLQRPDFYGRVTDLQAWTDAAHQAGALAVLSCDPISLALLKNPAEMNFDLAVGEAQPLGNPLSYGGPYVGFLAARESLLRKMPGRIVGETTDRSGRRSFVLTIQAREQHIRREKATSNICTSQALCALRSTLYLSLMGQSGLLDVARQSMSKAIALQQKLIATGYFTAIDQQPFFREFAVQLTPKASTSKDTIHRLNQYLISQGYIGGLELPDHGWLLAVTEKRTLAEMDGLVSACREFFKAKGRLPQMGPFAHPSSDGNGQGGGR